MTRNKWWGLLCLTGLCPPAFAQTFITLQIDVANQASFTQDVADPLRYATESNIVPSLGSRTFSSLVNMGDIVAVNGKPAKGTFVGLGIRLNFNPNPTAGQNAADVSRANSADWQFEILQEDGTPIGSIMAQGLAGGEKPPGAPPDAAMHNMAIVGGTGAFLGARGQVAQAAQPFTRAAAGSNPQSMLTDPVARRTRNGGAFGFVLQFVTLAQPEVAAAAAGPAIFHADRSPVTTARPARSGEKLTLRTTAPVASPVEVTAGEKTVAAVKTEAGDIEFVMPDVARGESSIRLTSAWVKGEAVKIAVE